MGNHKKALVLVDIQNDFIPGGALAVDKGDEIIPIVNLLQKKFELVVATQDWHPANHKSFASNNGGKKPGDIIDLNGLPQILWSDHCIQGSEGAEFHKDLHREKWAAIFQKGKNSEIDSYSGFYDNARRGDTGMGAYLKEKGVEQVFICGLALDYCVKFTAMDSESLGFDTMVITDATRAVNLNPEDGQLSIQELQKAGVKTLTSESILNQ